MTTDKQPTASTRRAVVLPATGPKGLRTTVEWAVEVTPNGVWFQEGRTALMQDETPARLCFVPQPVIDLLDQMRGVHADTASASHAIPAVSS